MPTTKRKIALIINSKAKQTDLQNLNRIYEALKKTDFEILEYIENDKQTISQFAEAAAKDNFEMVVAAGGDGTISSVATRLVHSNTALGVIPMGTYNNFAKDLGIPLDIETAVENLVSGIPKLIDVGEVNGHHFINNSSIGLYPHLVLRREMAESKGMPRIFATIHAALKVFQKFPYHKVKLLVGDKETHRETPLMFFGNGYYDFDGLNIGARVLPTDGTLSLYILKNVKRMELLKLSFMAFSNKIHNDPRFEKHFVSRATVEVPKKIIYVAKDGEVLKMQSPLQYKVKQRALKVIVPK
ncbi:MAG: sphingosine kinase [Candidatus Doudnabacteria bacterium]|nr:sphingosine kinase [Candidatus Doudnabacteria bacterium]